MVQTAKWSVKKTSILTLGFMGLDRLTEFSGYLRAVLLAVCVMIKGDRSTFGALRQEHFPELYLHNGMCSDLSWHADLQFW